MDPILQMFDSVLTMTVDTQSFLEHYQQLILLSDQTPDHTINRFMVKTVTLNKHTASQSQHEYLTFEIFDACRESPDTYLLFLERTPSSIQLDTSYFSNHPDSRRILDAIVDHLVTPSWSTLPPNPNESHEDLPLLDASSSSSTPTLSRVMDAASLTSTQALHHSGNILFKSTTVRACDQFLVGQHAKNTHGNGLIVRQLQPHGLTLFHLIVLAITVHKHDPLYSLLKRQCYWYSNTIYHTISNSYSCTTTINTGVGLRNETIEEIRIPLNEYLPDLAGRWMGVRVSNVSEALVLLMKEKFESDFDEALVKVCFYTNLIKFT
jgi:hypothetical protein